jgi:hypothetical protein
VVNYAIGSVSPVRRNYGNEFDMQGAWFIDFVRPLGYHLKLSKSWAILRASPAVTRS